MELDNLKIDLQELIHILNNIYLHHLVKILLQLWVILIKDIGWLGSQVEILDLLLHLIN